MIYFAAEKVGSIALFNVKPAPLTFHSKVVVSFGVRRLPVVTKMEAGIFKQMQQPLLFARARHLPGCRCGQSLLFRSARLGKSL